jgi:hypothetical protein
MSATPGIRLWPCTIDSSAAAGAAVSIAPECEGGGGTMLLAVAFSFRDRENFMAASFPK